MTNLVSKFSKLHSSLSTMAGQSRLSSIHLISRRLTIALIVALFTTTVFALNGVMPAYAAFNYRMIVVNSSGETLYLVAMPWDDERGQSSCIDMVGGLGKQYTIPAGGTLTLAFNRSAKCSGEQGWLSLRASHNFLSTGNDFQQFWFSNSGGLEKRGLMSQFQNILTNAGDGVFNLNILTATDIGYDHGRYDYRMTIKNETATDIWLTAAPDDRGKYGHLRSSCISVNAESATFGVAHKVPSGDVLRYHFSRRGGCSGLQGWFSVRSSIERDSTGTDFQQFYFSNSGGLSKRGVVASWRNDLEPNPANPWDYTLRVYGAEQIGGVSFRNYGYQRAEYQNWPGQNPIARELGTWNSTRESMRLTWRTNGKGVGRYVPCGGTSLLNRYWHTQAMIQLPSKGGRAYFARTDSFRRQGTFYVMRTDEDAYDPSTDYAKDTPGTDGEVVYVDYYNHTSPIGDWNHPGDMSVVGNLLVIAGQQWHGNGTWFPCGEFSYDAGSLDFWEDSNYDKYEGQDRDAVLFYDVSNPERPKYLGKITENEIGFSGQDAIDAVTLAKTTNGMWDLAIGGDGSKHFRTTTPWPNINLWQEYTNDTGEVFTINSYENGAERLRTVDTNNEDGYYGTGTIEYQYPSGTGFDLTADTTNATAVGKAKVDADLATDCEFGGGSTSVSQTGMVHIQCVVLREFTCGDEDCIVSTHYAMPDGNVAPNVPTNPVPASGSAQVESSVLSWTGGDPNAGDPVKYDVYLVGPSAVTSYPCRQTTATSCDVGNYVGTNQPYSWLVFAYDGKQRTTGPWWSFETAPRNDPPNAVESPIPLDNGRNESITSSLLWRGSDPNSADTLTYDVHFAPAGEPYALICDDIAATTCDPPGDLDYATTYRWYVEVSDGRATNRGGPWSFSTPDGIAVQVDAANASYRDSNEVINYTYTIENLRSVAINEPIAVVSNQLGTIAACGEVPLAAGASTSCTATYTTQEADVGKFVYNTVHAQLGAATSPSDRTFVQWDNPSKLGLVIEADPLVYTSEGQVVTYTYKIINIGETQLTGPFSVNHRHKEIGQIETCSDVDTLEVGGQTSCTALYTLTKQDLDGSLISSEASASATGSGLGTGGFSRIRIEEAAPALKFHIDHTPLSFSQVGEEITYTYRFSNTGNILMSGPFKVQIDGIGAAFDPCGSGPLEIDEATSCTNTYVVTQQDMNRGSLQAHNGRVSGNSVSSERFEVTVPGASSALLLTTVVSPTIYTRVGEEIVYQYTISNTGGLTLTAPVVLMNDLHGEIGCNVLAVDPMSDLGPGVAAVCRDVYEVAQEDLSRGTITSNAVAQVDNLTSGNVRSTVNAGSRAMALTVVATPQSYSTVGQVISYTYSIQNLSDVALNAPFTVIDDQVGTINACGEGPLAPNATTSCVAPRTMTQGDLDAGSITSNAFAFGDGATSPPVRFVVTGQATNPTNLVPTATDDQATTNVGAAITIDVTTNDSDPDGDTLAVTILTQPANGTATISNGKIVYTPNGGFVGNDSFIYSASDGKGGTATATVTVTVFDPANPNQSPTAADDAATTKPGVSVTINVTTNDSDEEGVTLTGAILTQPANGTATVSNGKIVYTPKAGFSGNDSFTYSVNDGRGGSATATATVAVTEDGTSATKSLYLPIVSNPN